MLLTIPFEFCLFPKILISCDTKYMPEAPTEMMTRIEALSKYIAQYMINDYNSVILGMKRCNENEYFPGP